MIEQTTLSTLHHCSEHPVKFWPAFLDFACRQCGADSVFLLGQKESSGTWKNLYAYSVKEEPFPALIIDVASAQLAEKALQTGSSHSGPDANGEALIAIALQEVGPGPGRIALFTFRSTTEGNLAQALDRLQLIADTPAVYQRQRAADQALKNLASIGETLDVMILLNRETSYLAAAMTLVNETAARYRCARVSLGWYDQGHIHLQAISHMDRFEKKMDIVSCLEALMEEALDQDEEILWPAPPENTAVVRDHLRFANSQQVAHLLSVPLRLEAEVVGVLTCERDSQAFSEEEVRGLRILCDQSARRLGDLKAADRPIFRKVSDLARQQSSKLLGTENTLTKLFALLTFLLVLSTLIFRLNYRVEAPFILRSEDVRQVSVPFEGFIDEVPVRIGQQVQTGDLLLSLDTNDLLLEEAEATANLVRYVREAEKARAKNGMSEMQIAQAQADQASARLELIRYRLSQAELRSPIDGIVVDGDLEELRGAPVNKGDILFKIARNEKLFAELKIHERDIHELNVGQQVQIAFVSQPQLSFAFTVEQIDPIAKAGEEGNLFRVRAAAVDSPASWWRPGMSGLGKVEVGPRRSAWILTHRTVDFFRLLLWW